MQKAQDVTGQFDGRSQYLKQMGTEVERIECNLSICEMSDYTVAVLPRLPAHYWRETRQSNIAAVSMALEGRDDIRIWPSTFGVILILPNTRTRDWLRQRLRAKSIYSAVLWHPGEFDQGSFNGVYAGHMLRIHADFRYDPAGIERITHSIIAVWADRDSLNIIQAAPNLDV